jgi:hypothetical protein
MAHALNLLFQDWGLSQWASAVVEDAQKIVKFIRARHVPLALFPQACGNLCSRVKPAKSRYNTVCYKLLHGC